MGVAHEFGSGILLEEIQNLGCCNLFGIEKRIYAKVSKDDAVVILLVLVVVDAGCHFLCPKLFGEGCRYYVDILFRIGVYGDEQVGRADTCPDEGLDRCRIPLDCNDVGFTAEYVQTFLVRTYDRDLVVLHTQHLGQMATYLPRSGNDNLHGF